MTPPSCPQCGADVPSASTGRPKTYCSPKCRTRARNDRHRTATGPIKRRGPRKKYARETHCLGCGAELQGQQRRFCSNPCAYEYWNSTRRNGKSETYHVLTDVDSEGRTATCKQCGQGTPIIKAGSEVGWRCAVAVRSEQRQPARREGEWRKRGIHLKWEDYQRMLEEQGGKCAICSRPMRPVHVDHCHESGEVRGLLCSPCNTGLGQFGDDPERLRAAIDYLSPC